MSNDFAKINPLKCWVCELQSEHHKPIDGTKRIKLFICSEKCRKVYIEIMNSQQGSICIKKS